MWARVKNWLAITKVRSIAKRHPNAIPVWWKWINGKVYGVVLKRTNDPNYAHDCYGILVLSAKMDWGTAIYHIGRYVGLTKMERIREEVQHLRGYVEQNISLLKQLCEIVSEGGNEDVSKK